MNLPNFLICHPAPDHELNSPCTLILRLNPASLWAFNSAGDGQLIAALQPLPLEGPKLATLARETGEWYAELKRYEDDHNELEPN